MMQRVFFSAFAAILLSVVLIQTAEALPTSATSARGTFSGAYRPLDFDLTTLVDGTEALDYDDFSLSFEVDLSGTFIGDGYPISGQAGNWRLVLNDTFNANVTSNDDGNVIYLLSSLAGLQVGTLTYLGGLSYTGPTVLPDGDTPATGDVFRLFSSAPGTVLQVVCNDGVVTCNDFDLTSELLQHIGPYSVGGGLDGERLNEACGSANDPHPCGSFTLTASSLTASSVPEPATLALLGLGLAGLGLSRRARRPRS